MAILKDYNESSKKWEGVGAIYIANDDGTQKVTPDEVKKKADKAAVDSAMEEKADKTVVNEHLADYNQFKNITEDHVDNGEIHVTNQEKTEWNNKANTSGTYSGLRAQATTKSDVGLGSVQNYAIATQAQAQAGTVNNRYMTPLRVAQAIEELSGGIETVTGTFYRSGAHTTVNLGFEPLFVMAYEIDTRQITGPWLAIRGYMNGNSTTSSTGIRIISYGFTTSYVPSSGNTAAYIAIRG